MRCMKVATMAASTYHGEPITLQGIQRAMADLDALGPPPNMEPMRLTRRELSQLADALDLEQPAGAAPSSLLGVPIIEVDESSAVARLFTLRQRIERIHPLLKGWT